MEDKNDLFLTIPVQSKELGDFITSLLGQTQIIEREIYGQFDIDLVWLLKVVDIITTRIESQNIGRLIDFACDVFFDNNSKRTLHSISELEHFDEIKPYETTKVLMRWSYLVKFREGENPEKQELFIDIDISPPQSGYENVPYGKFLVPNIGRIEYSIQYTERTWGNDLDRLISDEMDKVISRRRRLGSIVLRTVVLFFSFVASTLFIFLPLLINERHEKSMLQTIIDTYETTTETAAGKLNVIYDILTLKADNAGLSYGVMFLGVFFSAMILLLSMMLLTRTKPSFITISSYDQKIKRKKLNKRLLKSILIISGYLLTLGLGILSNILYARFFG